MNKIQRMFRQHDTAPAGIESALYRQLTQEWADLHALSSTRTTVHRWTRTHPTLAGLDTPGQIIDAIDDSPNARKDELLLALVTLFQAGHQLAGRTVLQAMLPKLAHTSARASSLCTSSLDSWAEDRRHITIAEFWDVMSHYPTGRRPSSVASNLALDTLHRVCGTRRPADDVPVDPHEFRAELDRSSTSTEQRTWLAGLTSHDTRPDDLTPEADLLQVITWGLKGAIITTDEAQLLADSYLPDTTTGHGFADVAAHLGLSQAAVRQRCSRAARRLTDAVQLEMLGRAASGAATRAA